MQKHQTRNVTNCFVFTKRMRRFFVRMTCDECYRVTPLLTCQLVNISKWKPCNVSVTILTIWKVYSLKGLAVPYEGHRLYTIIILIINTDINLRIISPDMAKEQFITSKSSFTRICLTISVINSWFIINDSVLYLFSCGWMRSWLCSDTRPLVLTFPSS